MFLPLFVSAGGADEGLQRKQQLAANKALAILDRSVISLTEMCTVVSFIHVSS